MINSIFLSFDLKSCENRHLILTYLYILLPPIAFIQISWSQLPTRFIIQLNILSAAFLLCISTKSKYTASTFTLISTTFYAILIINLRGLAPAIYSPTSHLILTLSISLPLWLSIAITVVITNTIILKSHIVPENTPTLLINFLSSVESLRSSIRPITLSFRLAANISAGHIILTIIRRGVSNIITTSLLLILIPIWLLTTASYGRFEVIVCLVQAFVFMLLSIIYTNDYNAKAYDINYIYIYICVCAKKYHKH